MWELLFTLGRRTIARLAAVRSVMISAVSACARGAVGVCARHPRWSGATLGVAVVAAGWGMLAESTTEPLPADAARLTGMDGELIPVLPDVVEPTTNRAAAGRRNAGGLVSPVSLSGRGESSPALSSPALPLLPSGQPVLHQPPLYRPASVASYRPEEPEESQAVWLMGTIEESGPPPTRLAAQPADVHIPALWPRH